MSGDETEYWALWGERGQDWQEILRHIDPTLAAFAETKQMEMSRWRWDAPDRSLTWASGDLERSLHVYLEVDQEGHANSIIVEGSAWQDQWFNEIGKRIWHTEHLDTISLSSPISTLNASLGTSVVQALENGFQQVDLWNVGDLNEDAHLSR